MTNEAIRICQIAQHWLGPLKTARIKPIVFLALSVALTTTPTLGDCKCGHPDKGETTHWGGNQMIVLVEESSYQKLQGTIGMYDGQPIEGALVEVFDHPEYLLKDLPVQDRNHSEQKRLAACRTSADGKFCFRNLASGRYELRSSLSAGWDVTHIYVVVDKKAGRIGHIQVRMQVGT